MRILIVICWLGTLAAAGFAAFLLFMVASTPGISAPQEGAGAAAAAAVAIIPYVFTRALEGLAGKPKE